MEKLLNKLIEKGWKPFDVDVKIKRVKCFHSVHFIVRWLVNFVLDGYAEATVPLRELCAKDSGLWQFVCENGMVNGVDRWTLNARQKSIYDKYITSEKEYTPKMNYEYRLIESALKDESELEDFLLYNIKVDDLRIC